MQSLNGILGFLDAGKGVGDEMVCLKFTSHVALHEDGGVPARLPAAKRGFDPAAASHELEGTGGNFFTGRGDTNHAAHALATVSALQRGAQGYLVFLDLTGFAGWWVGGLSKEPIRAHAGQ